MGGSRIGQTNDQPSLPQYASHPRGWRRNLYVYPVISRRSGGLSVGVNLNPDGVCNFNCVYCQVDRSKPAKARKVDPDVLSRELADMLTEARNGVLFRDPSFSNVPEGRRSIRDIAFSGDGEPTIHKNFSACVQIAAKLKREAGLEETRIVLITNACYLTGPEVRAGLEIMDQNNGCIWAKLDAGTEEYFQLINRSRFPLGHVIENIIAAARIRPVVIQSMFLSYAGKGPSDAELSAYSGRLREILAGGGKIDHVQVYTVARPSAEVAVKPLASEEVDRIADLIRSHTGLRAEAYYGPA